MQQTFLSLYVAISMRLSALAVAMAVAGAVAVIFIVLKLLSPQIKGLVVSHVRYFFYPFHSTSWDLSACHV